MRDMVDQHNPEGVSPLAGPSAAPLPLEEKLALTSLDRVLGHGAVQTQAFDSTSSLFFEELALEGAMERSQRVLDASRSSTAHDLSKLSAGAHVFEAASSASAARISSRYSPNVRWSG